VETSFPPPQANCLAWRLRFLRRRQIACFGDFVLCFAGKLPGAQAICLKIRKIFIAIAGLSIFDRFFDRFPTVCVERTAAQLWDPLFGARHE
jgi:hypothetical protein